MTKRITVLAVGLALAAGLAVSGCSSSGGGSDDHAGSKPSADAPADSGKDQEGPAKDLTPAQRKILLKALEMGQQKPDGVSDDDLAEEAGAVCQGAAQGKSDQELVADVKAKLELDQKQAAYFVGAAKESCKTGEK